MDGYRCLLATLGLHRNHTWKESYSFLFIGYSFVQYAPLNKYNYVLEMVSDLIVHYLPAPTIPNNRDTLKRLEKLKTLTENLLLIKLECRPQCSIPEKMIKKGSGYWTSRHNTT